MLARRLARRGLAVSGEALAAALSQEAASAAVPISVVACTIKVASMFAAGQGAISGHLAALTERMLKAMLLTKLRIPLTLVLALALGLAGTVVAHRLVQTQAAQPSPKRDQLVPGGQAAASRPGAALLAPAPDEKQAEKLFRESEKKLGDVDQVPIQPAAGPEKRAKPLPAEIVAAWKKAGAQVGWMSRHLRRMDNPVLFLPEEISGGGKEGELPAFGLSEWQEKVGKLPQPDRSFGLSLALTLATDPNGFKGHAAMKAGLKGLGELKSLRALELHWPVTDVGLKEVAGLKSLELLSLARAEITDAGLKSLAGLQSLQWLDLAGVPVTDAGLKALAGLQSLETLDLSNTKVTDAGLKELLGFKSLRQLILSGTPVTDAGLKTLAGLQSLQTLDLIDTKVTDKGLKELAGLVSLRTLWLAHMPVTDAGLQELAGIKELQALHLDSTKVTGTGLKALAGRESLRVLSLRHAPVTDAGLRELAGLKQLQVLTLHETEATDVGLKALAGLESLRDLDLGYTRLTDTGLKALAGLKSLRHLSLGGTRCAIRRRMSLSRRPRNFQRGCSRARKAYTSSSRNG
jgi:internalin A